MAEHKHGDMNIDTHEQVFEGFIKMVTRAAIVIVVGLVLLALING